jgi:hypothetical protein
MRRFNSVIDDQIDHRLDFRSELMHKLLDTVYKYLIAAIPTILM